MKKFLTISGSLLVLLPSSVFSQSEFSWQHPLPQGNNLTGVEYMGDGQFIAVGTGETAMISTDYGTSWFVQSNILGTVANMYGPSVVGDVVYAIGVHGYFDDDGGIAKSTDRGLTWTDLPFYAMDYASISFGSTDFGFCAGGFVGLYRTTNGGATWEHLDATMTGPFGDIDCLNESQALAVTSMGIVRTTDGGDSWTEQIREGVTAVEFVDQTVAYAVGSEIIKSTDGGSTWTSQLSGTSLNELSFVSGEVGYAIGGTGTVLKTTNGGTEWIDVSFQSSAFLTGVSFASRDTGVVVGEDGVIFQTLDGGNTWVEIRYSVSEDPLFGVSFGDSLTGVAVGANGVILRTANGGGDWYAVSSGVTSTLYSVEFQDSLNGIAVGSSGIVVQTSDAGSTWLVRSSGTVSHLRDFCYMSPLKVMAVGDDRTIQVSTNGGVDWMDGGDPGTGGNFSGVAFGDSLVGGIVGDGAYVLRTTDGGITWTRLAPGKNVLVLSDIDVASPGHIVAVGSPDFVMGPFGVAIFSTDTGATWVQTNLLRGLYGVSFTSPTQAVAVGSAGSGYETTDGGSTWHGMLTSVGKQNQNYDVAFETSSGKTVIVGSSGSILSSSPGIPPQETPLLSSPTDDSVFVTPKVPLSWGALPFVFFYSVQVSPDPNFIDLAMNLLVAGTSHEFNAEENGTYFWRVSAANSAGNGPWSETRQFVIDVAPPVSPIPLSPTNGATLQTQQVPFAWNHIQDATTYTLQVSNDELFADLVVDQTGIVDSLYSFDFSTNGVYYWHVSASNIGGNSSWSGARSFTVEVLLPAPVELISPVDSAVILGPGWRFLWLQPQDMVTRYWFELATDSTFSSAFIDSALVDTAITISNLELERDYWWRVRAENFAGWGPFQRRQFRTYETEIPQSFVLDQNYPNPFNGSTIIRFGVPHETSASVTLYDAIGRRVRIIFSGTVKEGYHEVTVDAKHFASGVYWYEMVSDGYRDRKKLMLVR